MLLHSSQVIQKSNLYLRMFRYGEFLNITCIHFKFNVFAYRIQLL